MLKFLARYPSLVTHVLSGFDRLVFRGILRSIRDRGMHVFLTRAGKRIIDFKEFAKETSDRVEKACLLEAEQLGRPVRYLQRSSTDKEQLARTLLKEHPVEKGLICALKVIEPCMSFEYHRSPDRKARGLRLVPRKCLHIYKYFLHPRFGFMNARIQTWFPFNVQICMNGREWLAGDLARRGSDFKRADNCFPWLQNPELAQRLMDDQLRTDWPTALEKIGRSLNPLHDEIFKPWPMNYYWVGHQTEWATDVVFRNPAALGRVYPTFVRHAMTHFKSPDVLRFLGRSRPSPFFTGELSTSFKNRPEGVRVKHWARGNSIKMYDKAGSVLRVETTIGNPTDFRAYRPANDQPDAKLKWLSVRKSVADLHRRAQVSQRANEAYLDALSVVDETTPCSLLFDSVARPVVDDGRRYRPIRIGDADDLALLQVIARGEFATAGFRNRDVRRILQPASFNATREQQSRAAAKIGRRLRLFRAHGLIRKVRHSTRYELTKRGHLLAAAVHAVREASLNKLIGSASAAS